MITLGPLAGARATIVARRALRYTPPPDPSEDVPDHVRAASALVQHGDALWIAQDDTNAIAHVDRRGEVHAVLLPRGPDGGRCFDDRRGNKDLKLDLEAAVLLDIDGAPRLVAFGSGSKPARERAVIVDVAAVDAGDADAAVRVVSLAPLYAALRAHPDLLTSELNLEGAMVSGDHVVFAQRGNGLVIEGKDAATCALVAVRCDTIRALLAGGTPAIALEDARGVALGKLGGARLTLTDLATFGGRTWFSASAEDSPDAVRDGEVTGSAVGVFAGDAQVGGDGRAADGGFAVVTNTDGSPSRDKIEGVVVLAKDRCLAVVDADDGDRPAELLTIALEGFV